MLPITIKKSWSIVNRVIHVWGRMQVYNEKNRAALGQKKRGEKWKAAKYQKGPPKPKLKTPCKITIKAAPALAPYFRTLKETEKARDRSSINLPRVLITLHSPLSISRSLSLSLSSIYIHTYIYIYIYILEYLGIFET